MIKDSMEIMYGVVEVDEEVKKLNEKVENFQSFARRVFYQFYSVEYDQGKLKLQGDYYEYQQNKPKGFPEISKFKLNHIDNDSEFYIAQISSFISAVLVKRREDIDYEY